MNSFYNTNQESGNTLIASEASAAHQDRDVADLFRRHPSVSMTAEDVWALSGMKERGCPITSPRRSLSNLTTAGVLSKGSKAEMKMGSSGKRIHVWKLNINPAQTSLLDGQAQG